MERLSLLFDQERRKERRDDKNCQIRQIICMYQKTITPFVPRHLKQAVDFKTIEDSHGVRRIGFTLASEGLKLVEPESLEMIRKKLLKFFRQFPKISKAFENPLPRNTIAISFGERDFQIGESCQEFSPIDTAAQDSFILYRQLSANLQATYHQEDDVEFLAGLCYYPVLNGKPKLLKNDLALINLALSAAEEYPLGDRNVASRKVLYNRYGRYCTKAGIRVPIDCSGLYGKICHVEFDHVLKKDRYIPCEECLQDSLTYKWVGPKKAKTPEPVSTSASEQLEDSNNRTSPDPVTTDASQQHGKTLEEQILPRIQELMLANKNLDGIIQFDHKVPVFNRNTGELLETSKWPKIIELSTWLDSNLDYNVSCLNAILAQLSLGCEYKDRIGGDYPVNSKLAPSITEPSAASAADSQLACTLHSAPENDYEDQIRANNNFTSVSSTSVDPVPSSTLASNVNSQISTTEEVSSEFEDKVSLNSPISSNAEESPEAPSSPESSISPSPASSTESLLEDYDKIDEETTEYNEEFNAEMIN